MKAFQSILTTVLVAGFLTTAFGAFSAEKTKSEKVKAYPLEKCVVSDEKLGSMGKPYVFTNENQEVKLCCKDCLKDFNKSKAKYMAKIEKAEKK